MKTDAQLIEDARNDPDAFGELYRRHAPHLGGWFRARAPERAASELTAETFAQAALSLRRFRDEAAGSAAPWLYGIAKNLLRRYHEQQRVERRARERLGLPIQAYELDLDQLGARADAAELRTLLGTALDALPAGQREAVELRVLRELSYDEVAASLGCSAVAARLRVMRGLGSLARLMKGASS